jgi:hypothetical protein
MKQYMVLQPPGGFGFHKKVQEWLNNIAKDGWELHTAMANAFIFVRNAE